MVRTTCYALLIPFEYPPPSFLQRLYFVEPILSLHPSLTLVSTDADLKTKVLLRPFPQSLGPHRLKIPPESFHSPASAGLQELTNANFCFFLPKWSFPVTPPKK